MMKRIFDRKELNGFYRYCVSLTGDEQTAWDLLQNSLERWVRLANQEVRHPGAYFKRMLRNRFVDDRRKEGHRDEQAYDDTEAVIPIGTHSLEDMVATRQEVDVILNMLTPSEREILFLWAVEEYTAQDIADHLSEPRGTILSRIFRLRNKIRLRVKKLRYHNGNTVQKTY